MLNVKPQSKCSVNGQDWEGDDKDDFSPTHCHLGCGH